MRLFNKNQKNFKKKCYIFASNGTYYIKGDLLKTKTILKPLYAISYPIPINEMQLIMDKELLKDLAKNG